MKDTGKKKIIILSIIAIVLLCAVSVILIAGRDDSAENYTLEFIYEEYLSADDSVVAAVNGEAITNKDLCIIKYLYRPSNAVDQAIEQKVLLELAKSAGFSLDRTESDKEISYIDERYGSLNLPENEQNAEFKEALRKNYMELVTGKGLEAYIETQILHQEFSCDNKRINKKYEKYKSMYEKWEDGGKADFKLYDKIWNLRKEIAQDYIAYQSKQVQIEKY